LGKGIPGGLKINRVRFKPKGLTKLLASRYPGNPLTPLIKKLKMRDEEGQPDA